MERFSLVTRRNLLRRTFRPGKRFPRSGGVFYFRSEMFSPLASDLAILQEQHHE